VVFDFDDTMTDNMLFDLESFFSVLKERPASQIIRMREEGYSATMILNDLAAPTESMFARLVASRKEFLGNRGNQLMYIKPKQFLSSVVHHIIVEKGIRKLYIVTQRTNAQLVKGLLNYFLLERTAGLFKVYGGESKAEAYKKVLSDSKTKPCEVLVVGNSYEEDLKPAAKLGMRVYHTQGTYRTKSKPKAHQLIELLGDWPIEGR
jgi:FMN phosphatase YigB (HAD superfamily)